MKYLKIAAACLNQTPMDWHKNRHNILDAIAQARTLGAGILCLPELCITGYGCEDAFMSEYVVSQAMRELQEIAGHTQGMIVSVGLPIRHQKSIYNAACLLSDGEILGFTCKRHLAGSGIHYEPRWFQAWTSQEVSEIEIEGRMFPVGELCYDVGGIKIGFEICEDAWVGHRRARDYAQDVNIILNPSASHFAFEKHEIRRQIISEGSRSFGVIYAYANLLGCEAGRIIYDGDAMIAEDGKVIASGPRFSFKDVQVTAAVVRTFHSQGQNLRSPEEQSEVKINFIKAKGVAFSPVKLESNKVIDPSLGLISKNEEFARSVALGLWDYLRKSKSQGFVVSLSGGADSSTVTSLVAIMVSLAVKDLGLENCRMILSFHRHFDQMIDRASILKYLLTCVYQSTKNNSEETFKAAELLAQAVGAEFYHFDVDHLVASYKKLAEVAIGRSLDWQKDDLALQNIQARTRAPGVWLVANLKGAILLTTSNRSEAAVGYATMDGDTCGGLCPIGGVDKAFIFDWLKWLEKDGFKPFGKLPALSLVNQMKPTAELRPADQSQTDENDLMPYRVLDRIERAAIRDKLSPKDCLKIIESEFSETYAPDLLKDWVKKFFRLWSRNQWKRERLAPSFHLDDENLDPKTWCRWPILSGGFRVELDRL